MTVIERQARAALRVLAGKAPSARVCANGCGRPVVVRRWALWFCAPCTKLRCVTCRKRRDLAHWLGWFSFDHGAAHGFYYAKREYPRRAVCGFASRPSRCHLGGGFHGAGRKCKVCVRLTTTGKGRA